MKYRYLIIVMLVCFHCGYSQNVTSGLDVSYLLSNNDRYVTNVKMLNGGTIELQVTEAYFKKENSEKKAFLEMALNAWSGEIIFIYAGYNREIWRKDITTGQIILIGKWDLNNAEIYKYLPTTLETTKFHPFFFYVGGQANFNSGNLTLFFSTRVGSFLYKDRWDLALSGSVSITDNDFNSITNTELGLMSKVYFPIRKYNISPYVGAGVSRVFVNSSMEFQNENADFNDNYWNKMLLIGISWYVGPGSFDLGAQIGDNFNLTMGYTFSF